MAIFGCVADDFTGAGDAASFLVKGGLPTQLFNGIPKEGDKVLPGVQAIVIALKTRTQETTSAVEDTMKALLWMGEQGVEHFYLKYCSTFDSTREGNIGPIADRAMELTGSKLSLLCPSLPVNGRTVKDGCLYVNGVPLQESPMKNHPLTPMWDCRIQELMKDQSIYPCKIMDRSWFGKDLEEVAQAFEGEKRTYLIPDYETDEDGEKIAAMFYNLPLLTGGSGLLEPLARLHAAKLGISGESAVPESTTKGGAFMVAGSCSKATLGQIKYFQEQGGLSCRIDPVAMAEGKESVEDVWSFIKEHQDHPVLVYSSDTADNVKKVQEMGRERIASMLEQASAALAKKAVEAGMTRIIVAGGETSGAVTKGLGFDSYRIGESVAPGVPIMIPAGREDIRLVLKSGNFGQEDFFTKVLEMTEKKEGK